ncbi:double zinc ribbon domain-containing protein [Halobacterium wangiae]|uniref:double zinc ribbon domain-containing protein n=1 Tax=Halobacterium wangiae TaxID=2902623 RepID=UPI001E65D382|nr:zinc ribbon domain-containing protein [Halobacterium wangiae]
MSKITFRADNDLVDAVEDLDASKSEVMRDALRTYLDEHGPSDTSADSLDDVVADRVDELVEQRLGVRQPAQDVNVRITVEPAEGLRAERERERARQPASEAEPRRTAGRGGDRTGEGSSCAQCGETVSADHVYCPNCGEKASRRVFCECGDEVRADWAFCPHCGRRTASADALER